jgi:Na+-transporting NADH:ubiquinone oxidoreductase subunit B
MKFLRNLLDNVKPHFEKGGKFEKLHPAYDAFETFLFVPGHTSHGRVHVLDSIDLKRTMITVVLSLVPCLLFGIWNTGHQHFLALGLFPDLQDGFSEKFLFGLEKVLPIIIVSYVAGLTIEFIAAIMRGHQVNEGFLVTGLLIPMIMPVDTPLWMIAVATIFAVLIGKEVFGGTGMNILNPALTARAFLFFAYPVYMSGDKIWINTSVQDGQAVVDGFSGATPLAQAAAGNISAVPSTSDLLFGFIPGSIGETSALACLIGAAILIYTGIGSWRIIFSVILGGLFMGAIFNLVAINPFMSISPVDQLLLGGFMFGAVFMATDPVSGAQTNTGKFIYGFLIGLLAILIRVFNPAYPEGMMLAILFMNVMAPLVDHYVVEANISRRTKRAKNLRHA